MLHSTELHLEGAFLLLFRVGLPIFQGNYEKASSEASY